MADPRGFMKVRDRQTQPRRPVPVRIMDWKEVYEAQEKGVLKSQAGRCMDCGVPFCHQGCPLGNLIPEWNDLVWRDKGEEAIERLHATNNFPEFTGRLCPAPCESSCVLGINQPAVTIKQVEVSIIDQAFDNDWVKPLPPARLTGHTVAVVGSGPAGLAVAQQLTRVGHTVAVYERDDRIGGLLRYGIPDFKMEKEHLDRRLEQMRAEGTRFRAGVEIGKDISWEQLRRRYDAVVICAGATVPRDLPIPGRELSGVHFAMDYLVQSNRAVAGDEVAGIDGAGQIYAAGKHVVILGGGDTGADCLGTAHRQQAASVSTLAIGKQPPAERPEHQPWPMFPTLFEVASAHEEGGERTYLASTVEFVGTDGVLTALKIAETEYRDGQRVPKPGTEREIPADLVFLSLGFTGAEPAGITEQVGAEFDPRGNVDRDGYYMTNTDGVFVAGDAGRGQSLIVWAIAEGRACAAAVDNHLSGSTSLPAPVSPTDVAISPL
ncbi:glutamate synthase [NADPH] small chain [Renibacterium salmoninarum ATCC 33209]|uniref:Glutamate synthase [NADPH] small chain n=1 Tax=Renibacterium salmoninarum (strain ATCC 33209 / DSM 20767 / JCM 11484 / NBRC 15589 / NCIMB 2235) TaxID=288705 RepID=A9WR49_RENSM|nr:glutamate synthase subunit beta [Renibacterium salmoninarum]ABY24058.1 glutamate synthase [NADPH] small chain [Renibacterium salmoninarum ATCC 33209]